MTKSVFTKPTTSEVVKKFNSIKSADDEAASGEGMPFYYVLPRQGRTMKVACNKCSQSGDERDFVIFEYEWNGTKFFKK